MKIKGQFMPVVYRLAELPIDDNPLAAQIVIHALKTFSLQRRPATMNGSVVWLEPGEVLLTLGFISEKYGVTKSAARNALSFLLEIGALTRQRTPSAHLGGVFSIRNIIAYDQFAHTERTTSAHLVHDEQHHYLDIDIDKDLDNGVSREIYTQDKENIFDQKSTTPKAPQKRAKEHPVKTGEAGASLGSRAARSPLPSNYDYNLEYEANDPEIRASYMQDEELLALNECFPLGYATETASRGSERENLTSSSSSQKKSLTGKAKPKKKAVTREEDEDFRRFWEAYPRKVGKEQAWKTFSRMKKNRELPSMDTLLKAVSMFTSEISELEFTPHPSTWLNGKRWEDSEMATDGTEWAPKTQTEIFHTRNREKAKMPETANMAHSEASAQKPAPEPAPKQEPAPEPEDKDFPAVLAKKYRNKEYFMMIPWYNLDPSEYEWQQKLIRKRDAIWAQQRAEREAQEALEDRQQETAIQSSDIVIPDPPKLAPVHSLSRGERYRKDKEEIHKKWQSFFAGAREDAKGEQEVERRRKMLLDQQERLLAETKTANQ